MAKASTGGKKKTGTCWADSDTESDAEEAAPPEKKRDAFGDSESESESESEAEDGEGDSEVTFFKYYLILNEDGREGARGA